MFRDRFLYFLIRTKLFFNHEYFSQLLSERTRLDRSNATKILEQLLVTSQEEAPDAKQIRSSERFNEKL